MAQNLLGCRVDDFLGLAPFAAEKLTIDIKRKWLIHEAIQWETRISGARAGHGWPAGTARGRGEHSAGG